MVFLVSHTTLGGSSPRRGSGPSSPVKVPFLMDSAVEGKHTPSACAGFSDPLGSSRARGTSVTELL